MKLVEMVYRDTARFPREELYGLAAQMRRAAVSVPSNIAEGSARNSSRELVQYLGITCGSLSELETQLELAVRLGYLEPATETVNQANLVGKLVNGLRKSMRMRSNNPSP